MQSEELGFAAKAFSTIEINGSFYSLQTPASYAKWHAATPEDFVFAVKGPRYITHILRLNGIDEALANFFASGLFNLKDKLGPVLWQFPPSFRYDEEKFDRFLSMLPRSTSEALALARKRGPRMHGRSRLAIHDDLPMRHAIELRHPSFACASFVALLRRHGAGLVVADTAGKWPYMEDVTADFMYLRLHGDRELYASGYSDGALDRWASRIEAWARGREPADAQRAGAPSRQPCHARDVYCYFDNDVKVRAPFDADRLMLKLGLLRQHSSFRFPSRRALKEAPPVTPLPATRWHLGRKRPRPDVQIRRAR